MRIRGPKERRATLTAEAPGSMDRSRAASYLQALNQEGDEVPPQNSDMGRSQSRLPGSIIMLTSAHRRHPRNQPEKVFSYLSEQWLGVSVFPYILDLTWPLEMGSVLTRRLPEQELLPGVCLIPPRSGQLREEGQGSLLCKLWADEELTPQPPVEHNCTGVTEVLGRSRTSASLGRFVSAHAQVTAQGG